MEVIYQAPWYVKAFYVALLIVIIVRNHTSHAQAQKEKAVAFVPPQDPKSWRWPAVPEELTFTQKDDSQYSEISWPSPKTSLEIFCSGFAYLWLVFLLGMLFYPTNNSHALELGWAVKGFAWLVLIVPPILLLGVGSPLLNITLTPKQAIFSRRWGIFWHATKSLPVQKLAFPAFSGKLQSPFAMEIDKEQPDYYLFIKKKHWWQARLRFILLLTKKQGDWLVAGLNEWQKRASAKKKVE